jgi:hypothetical protein
MVKRQTMNSLDWVNEALVYDFCKLIGVSCAEYHPIGVKYFDTDLKSFVECGAVLTRIFKGDLVHYRDLRDIYGFGKHNDQMIDFLNKCPKCVQGFSDMILVDFVFNQEDRHAKNFGVVGEAFAPLFDSGNCLFCGVPDELLSRMKPPRSVFKAENKDIGEYLREFLGYGYRFEKRRLPKTADFVDEYADYMTGRRLRIVKRIIEERCGEAREMLAGC